MRRITTGTISLLVVPLLAMAVSAPSVAAKEDALADHPIVGTWIVESSPDDPTNPLELVTFNPGGTLVTVGPEGTTLGSWASSGERSADLTFKGAVSSPDAGFVGFFTIRASGEVSEDGQSFTGTYTIEPPPTMAEAVGIPVGQLGPGEVTGQRVEVEQMGETVGPLPDLEALAPAPEESPAG